MMAMCHDFPCMSCWFSAHFDFTQFTLHETLCLPVATAHTSGFHGLHPPETSVLIIRRCSVSWTNGEGEHLKGLSFAYYCQALFVVCLLDSRFVFSPVYPCLFSASPCLCFFIDRLNLCLFVTTFLDCVFLHLCQDLYIKRIILTNAFSVTHACTHSRTSWHYGALQTF